MSQLFIEGTDEEKQTLRERESVPSYIDPIMTFDDGATGKHILWGRWGGNEWLFYKHPDGQWVSWRKTTDRDRSILAPLLSKTFHND